MVTERERQWMWEKFAPEPRMRLNLGIRRRLAPLLDNDRRKIELAHSLLFSLPGSPILYYGDEIGMGDNIWLPDRNGVRTPMQWNAEPDAGFSDAPIQSLYAPIINDDLYGHAHINVESQRRASNSLWNTLRHMIATRKENHAFGRGEFEWIDFENNRIAGFQRTFEGKTILAIHNLSDSEQRIVLKTKEPVKSLTDLLSQQDFVSNEGAIETTLAPYQYLWLK
jgi:maltose alpha-D-glucosyltransferase/alpha-amylase